MTGTSKARSKWHTAPNLWPDKSSAAKERRLHWFGLTNRSHVAVRLFSNRSQMTLKCGKNKKRHTRRSRVYDWCSYHILTSSVIYYWIRRTAAWNLLVLYNNEKRFIFILKYFNIRRKPAFCPPLPRLCTKKSHWRDLWSVQNEEISLVAMRSKESWLVVMRKSCHCQTWLERRSSLNENLQRK